MLRCLPGHAFAILLVFSQMAFAQTPRNGRLIVTVSDQSGGILPNAVVTLGSEENTRAPVIVGHATEAGVATFDNLAPGRYAIKAEFSGFDTRLVTGVRVRAGENRQAVSLAIARIENTVIVGQDARTAASDRQGPAFGSALTREQVEALSDDPAEMRRQLAEMAGSDAVIRVDTFEGAQLPPKSQIKSIRITRDAFAAENHSAGAFFIDIITQPGIGPLRTGVNTRLRDGSMTGRSPFTSRKGPERTQDYGVNFGGTLIKEKASFSVYLNGSTSFETPNLNVALPTGVRSESLQLRTPREALNVNALFDYALTKDQTLRVGFGRSSSSSDNMGIGAYDLPERGFSTNSRQMTLRIQEAGPLARRAFINTRVMLRWDDSESVSALEAPTIRVNDAFTSGGQQQAGGRRGRLANIASDLDYVRARHSIRTGVSLEASWVHSDATSNYLGTYTFEDLAAYESGTPRTYTRRIGDPRIDYSTYLFGWYIQDDIRIRPGLTLTPGVRVEAQSHVNDYNNIGPRFGVTWAPFKGGKTTLRTSVGIFHDWLTDNTFEQTLRVDGFRQREINVLDPTYPAPADDEGIVPPVNRYLLGDDLSLRRTFRFSAGIDQAVLPRLRVNAQYTRASGVGALRGTNLNAPVDGVRPDSNFVNVIEVVSDAETFQQTLGIGMTGSVAPPSPPVLPPSAPRFDWKRLSFGSFYTLGWLRNNTEGDFSLAPSNSLADEWGYAPGDVRHRLSFNVSSQFVKGLNVNLSAFASTGTPYTIRTGKDDNGDLVFNDRPAGVARGTERTTGQFALNSFATYTFAFGRSTVQLPPGMGITIVNGVANVQTFTQTPARFRLGIYVQAQNLTNRANFIGYSGILGSPFYGRPTAIANPRRVDVGLNFSF